MTRIEHGIPFAETPDQSLSAPRPPRSTGSAALERDPGMPPSTWRLRSDAWEYLRFAVKRLAIGGEDAEALAGDEAARTAYEKLPFTHRKEYAEWVGSAVREATRVGRVTKALEMLRAGRTTP